MTCNFKGTKKLVDDDRLEIGMPLLLTTAISAVLFFLISGTIRAEEISGLTRDRGFAQVEPSDSAKSIPETTPGKKARTRVSSMHVYGFITEFYDNNILNYSDSDCTLFEAKTNPQRFEISNLDDYVTDVGVRFTYESGGRRSRAWRLRLKGDATLFMNNSYRHYTQWGIEIRKNIRHSYVELGLAWLPDYNLRNLYWRPMLGRPIGVRYAPANFKRFTYDATVSSEFSRRLDGRINISASRTNYDYPFDERDNTTFTEIAHVNYDLTKRVAVHGGFGLAQSRAAGKDSVNAIVKDISYNGTLLELGARFRCDRRGRVVVSTSVDYQYQKYLTTKLLDISHYHRIDHDYDFGLSLSWRVTEHLQPELNYEYRKTTSSVVPGAAEVGAFTGYRIGGQITAYL